VCRLDLRPPAPRATNLMVSPAALDARGGLLWHDLLLLPGASGPALCFRELLHVRFVDHPSLPHLRGLKDAKLDQRGNTPGTDAEPPRCFSCANERHNEVIDIPSASRKKNLRK
jgi:hypothetical protein